MVDSFRARYYAFVVARGPRSGSGEIGWRGAFEIHKERAHRISDVSCLWSSVGAPLGERYAAVECDGLRTGVWSLRVSAVRRTPVDGPGATDPLLTEDPCDPIRRHVTF